MTHQGEHEPSSLPINGMGQIIGIFALVGIGIGLTGAIAISQLGSDNAILSGILILVILTITFILGPVIGVVSGMHTGRRKGHNSESYLAGIGGSVVGYFAMMLLVLVILSIGLSLTAGGGTSGASQSGLAAGQSTGGGQIPIQEYLIPIITIVIPTAFTSVGGIYIGAEKVVTRDGPSVQIPRKYAAVGVTAILIIAIAVAVVPNLLAPNPQIEISGGASTSQNVLYAEGTVSNPSDSEITTTLTVELVINDQTVATTEDSITIPPNDDTQLTWRIATVDDLTRSEVTAIQNGNFELRYIVNGEIIETFEP